MRLHLVAPAATIDAADAEARVLRGVVVPYGVPGATSMGVLTVDAGALRVPDNLRRVKLFREHGRTTPVGHALEANDTPADLFMAFTIGRTPDGDLSLLEASEGLRDAFSVELDNVTLDAGHVTAGDLVAVAQVAVPAYASALMVAALSDDAQAQVADLAGQIVALTEPSDTEGTEDTMPETTAAATTTTGEPTTPEVAASLTVSPVVTGPTRHDASTDRRVWAAQVANVMRGASDAAQVNAALTDITPTSAATGDVFPRPQWLGELWQPAAANRPVVDAIGVTPLTGMKLEGWKWAVKPEVAPYAGNKAAVPSSPASIVPAESLAQRIAGGWDLDRIYFDFSTGFVEAFQSAAVEDYRRKSETYLVDGHAAVTGPPAIPAFEGLVTQATDLGAQADVPAALTALVGFLTSHGASVSFVVMAADVFAEFLAMPEASVPWWLKGQSTINLGGTADVAGTTITSDPAMAAGTILAGDRAAVTFAETGPINVQAVNLPNGGIDLGLFGYYASIVHDDDGLATAQVAGGGALAAPASSRTRKSTD